jgi:hypothetical protein
MNMKNLYRQTQLHMLRQQGSSVGTSGIKGDAKAAWESQQA